MLQHKRNNKGQFLPGPTLQLAERFWLKVDKNSLNGCWNWLASKDKHGYGKFGKGEPSKGWEPAHRVAYRLMGGIIPVSLELDHLCRNPSCVNPAHLQIVTPRENGLRGVGQAALNAAKTHCPQGHPYDLFNTYFYIPKGEHYPARQCAICRKMRTDAWNQRKLKSRTNL